MSDRLIPESYLNRRMAEMAPPHVRARSQPLGDWATQHVRLEGRPFSFEGHGYLRAIYDDTAPHVVLMKAAQVGGTTWAVLRSVHACLSGLNVIYFFPTRSDVIEFSKSRVGPLIEENAFLRNAVKDTDTAGLKRIGDAHFYLRGMKSAVEVKSVPADLVVFDELDEATPDAKARAKERLAHSSYKRLIELSNPSLPDYGIDQAFAASDQRLWHLKCPSCNAWTCLEQAFPRKLNEEVRVLRRRDDGSVYRACPACDTELDLEAGEWVATFPEREIHGYRISQLFSAAVDPGEILRDYEMTRHPDRFYNLKIGIPWVDRANRLTVDEVLARCGEKPMEERSPELCCTMGVDTGRDLHVVIGQPQWESEWRKIIFMGICESFDELDRLMARYNVGVAVVDGLPETHAARAFANRWPYEAFLCFFSEHQRGSAHFDEENHTVTVNRTEALDASRRAIRDGKVTLPREDRTVRTFAEHMANDAKQLVEDPDTGQQRYKYVRTGVDHYSLAFTYECIAADSGRILTHIPIW